MGTRPDGGVVTDVAGLGGRIMISFDLWAQSSVGCSVGVWKIRMLRATQVKEA